MKKITTVFLALNALTAAAHTDPVPLKLDKVDFQVSAKQWVTTQSVLFFLPYNRRRTR